jgi:hypothetical protein
MRSALKHVVIGGFRVLRFLKRIDGRRLRDDKELGEEDVAGAEHLRVNSRHSIIDIMRGGLLPIDPIPGLDS